MAARDQDISVGVVARLRTGKSEVVVQFLIGASDLCSLKRVV
jgi:hypothetical protein